MWLKRHSKIVNRFSGETVCGIIILLDIQLLAAILKPRAVIRKTNGPCVASKSEIMGT